MTQKKTKIQFYTLLGVNIFQLWIFFTGKEREREEHQENYQEDHTKENTEEYSEEDTEEYQEEYREEYQGEGEEYPSERNWRHLIFGKSS